MKIKHNLVSALLAASMAAASLVSCGDNSKAPDTTTATPDIGGTTTADSYADDLPSDLNFAGADFTILTRTAHEYEAFAAEQTGDTLSDAVYNRNLAVEERLGVNIVSHAVDGEWAQREEYTTALTTSVLAGDGAFDLAVGYCAYMTPLVTQDLFYNALKLKYTDTSKDYYFADAVKELTYNNQLYFMVSDYCLTMWENLYVTYFNKQLAADNQLPDLYDLVRDGKFTMRAIAELSKDIYSDMNGDNKSGPEDLFGFISDYQNVADAYSAAFDNPVTRLDENGSIYFAENNEKTVEILEFMKTLLRDTPSSYAVEVTSKMVNNNPLKKIFTDGRALFYQEMLSCAVEWRSMPTDFGILPVQKWDESQERYQSQCWNGFSVVTVPSDAKNPDMSSAVFEALSSISQEYVISPWFDTVLTAKAVRDDESGEMINLTRDGIMFNFGYMNGVAFMTSKCAGRIYRDLLSSGSTDLSSAWAGSIDTINANFAKFLEAYEE